MREMLADIDMLSPLSSTDQVGSPLNTGGVASHRGVGCVHESHVLKQVAEVEYLSIRFQSRIVFRLCCRQQYSLLHLGSPLDNSWDRYLLFHLLKI